MKRPGCFPFFVSWRLNAGYTPRQRWPPSKTASRQFWEEDSLILPMGAKMREFIMGAVVTVMISLAVFCLTPALYVAIRIASR